MRTFITALLVAFVANMLFFTDAHAAAQDAKKSCPVEGSKEFSDLIFQEGPVFMETGKAGECLTAMIQSEKTQMERMGLEITEKEVMESIMIALIKEETAIENER